MNLIFELGRAQRVLEDLERLIVVHKKEISSYKSKEGKQQDGQFCLMDETWEDYRMGTAWSQVDAHRWFRTTVTIPESMGGHHVEFLITTGREGGDESADAVLSGRRAHARSGCESPGGDDYKKCQSRGMSRDRGTCIQWDGKG